MPATVIAIHLCEKGRAPLRAVERASALLDRGLDGDRHARAGSQRQVLLMEREVLDQLSLAPGDVREQLTVAGLALDALGIGARMTIGSTVFEVAGPCDPCERMEEIRTGLSAELAGRRGRFVRVVQAGTVAVGDPIVVEPGEPPRP